VDVGATACEPPAAATTAPYRGCQTPKLGSFASPVLANSSSQKFKTRYATLGFSQRAKLDEGAISPTAFALKELTTAEEARIGALVKRAVS
jgi:hypothetical protein